MEEITLTYIAHSKCIVYLISSTNGLILYSLTKPLQEYKNHTDKRSSLNKVFLYPQSHLQQQLSQYLRCNDKTLLEHTKILEENERLKKQVQELELENKQLLARLASISQQNYESSTVPYS